MSGNLLIMLELLLVFGVVVGFGIRELVLLRRHRRATEQSSRSQRPTE